MNINPWAAIQQLIDKALAGYCPYDIDDAYVTFSNTEPAQRWPGTTWEQITDCMLRAADSTHPAGSTGGAWEVVQTVEQMPKHNHAYASFQKGYPASFAEENLYITPIAVKPYNGATKYKGSECSYSGAGEAMPIVNKYTACYIWKRTG